jgi:hypothetical protein
MVLKNLSMVLGGIEIMVNNDVPSLSTRAKQGDIKPKIRNLDKL